MGDPNVNAAYTATGRLAYGCNDLSAVWPHGGTGLGLVGNIVLSPPSNFRQHLSEGINSTWSVQHMGGDLIMGALIESWDDNDALAKLWPNVDAGATKQILKWPGTDFLPGTISDAMALAPLVFTPRDQTQPNAILIYKAAILHDVNLQLRLSSWRFLNYPVVFVALPDASGRLGEMGLLAELTL